MKKQYSTPVVDVIHFDYKDQVVVASDCIERYTYASGTGCFEQREWDD